MLQCGPCGIGIGISIPPDAQPVMLVPPDTDAARSVLQNHSSKQRDTRHTTSLGPQQYNQVECDVG